MRPFVWTTLLYEKVLLLNLIRDCKKVEKLSAYLNVWDQIQDLQLVCSSREQTNPLFSVSQYPIALLLA